MPPSTDLDRDPASRRRCSSPASRPSEGYGGEVSTAGESKQRPRGLAAFAAEFGDAWLAVLGATLGLGVIMASVTAAVEESQAWWQWALAVPLALVGIAFGCGVVLVTAGKTAERIAKGYLGMASRRCPLEEYGPRSANEARAAADLLFGCCALVLGVWLFRVGAAERQLNWAMEGLLLAFSGVGFGWVASVPRLRFRRPRRELVFREVTLPPAWIGLAVAFTLGAGLSFGVCQSFADAKQRAERARVEPAEGARR